MNRCSLDHERLDVVDRVDVVHAVSHDLASIKNSSIMALYQTKNCPHGKKLTTLA